jgi:hypothetical protein
MSHHSAASAPIVTVRCCLTPVYLAVSFHYTVLSPVPLQLSNGVMDVLSVAASIITDVQLSEDVASLCSRYFKAVKNAKRDMERLQGEFSCLKVVLRLIIAVVQITQAKVHSN